MSQKMLRLAMGLSYAIAFIVVGLGLFSEPHTGVIQYLDYWGISAGLMGWAFIVSGIFNALSGFSNSRLNPAAFGVFLFYNALTWQAFFDGQEGFIRPATFYTLISVVYVLNQIADKGEEYLAGD